MLDANQHRLGLGDDRLELGLGGAGLQRQGHRAELGQGDVDDGVVDAGEAKDATRSPGRIGSSAGRHQRA